LGGRGSSGEGCRRVPRGGAGLAVDLLWRGGSPAMQGLGSRAWELQEDMEKVVEWFI